PRLSTTVHYAGSPDQIEDVGALDRRGDQDDGRSDGIAGLVGEQPHAGFLGDNPAWGRLIAIAKRLQPVALHATNVIKAGKEHGFSQTASLLNNSLCLIHRKSLISYGK